MRAIRPFAVAMLLVAACNKPGMPAADAAASPSTSSSASAGAPTPAQTTTVTRAEVAMPSSAAHLASNSNAFAFELWRKLPSASENAAISPASISAAIAMAAGGARGETARQIDAVLHESGSDAAQWGPLIQALQSPSRALVLRVANRIFGDKSFHFEPSFLDQTRERFGAPLEPLDFAHAPEPARQHINGWVEEQTEHRIKHLLPPPAVTTATSLVLVDAIYFLAKWDSPFPTQNTQDEPFHLDAARTKNVRTMFQRHRFPFMQADGVSMIELPYKGDAAMWLVLPDRVDGLGEVEKKLSAQKLEAWKKALSTEDVKVSVPRFEIQSTSPLSLRDPLESLGMPLAFDSAKADFSGMGTPHLFVSDALHEAFVKVDEAGTEAAAATAVSTKGLGVQLHDDSKQFRADHPFLFFVVDKPTGLVLFMGRFVSPS